MEPLIIEKEYANSDNALLLIDKLVQEMIKNADPDFKTALAAGCEMEFTHDQKNHKIIVKTKYPISILKTPEGVPISVMQMAK